MLELIKNAKANMTEVEEQVKEKYPDFEELFKTQEILRNLSDLERLVSLLEMK